MVFKKTHTDVAKLNRSFSLFFCALLAQTIAAIFPKSPQITEDYHILVEPLRQMFNWCHLHRVDNQCMIISSPALRNSANQQSAGAPLLFIQCCTYDCGWSSYWSLAMLSPIHLNGLSYSTPLSSENQSKKCVSLSQYVNKPLISVDRM